jgi:hypothetical protein
MIATQPRSGRRPWAEARRGGYLVAIVINVVLVIVVNNVLAWDVLPFLTDEFGALLWLINGSLLATILVNFVYLAYDARWFKSLGQIGLNVISLVVSVRMYQVFPFDFSSLESDWSWLIRLLLVLGMVGLGVGIIVELAKLARQAASSGAAR